MGVTVLQQFPMVENRTGPATIDFLTKRVVALGAVQTGHFLVDCETYMSVPNIGVAAYLTRLDDYECWSKHLGSFLRNYILFLLNTFFPRNIFNQIMTYHVTDEIKERKGTNIAEPSCVPSILCNDNSFQYLHTHFPVFYHRLFMLAG